MMDFYLIFKLAHVIGACVLFGTGLGIAFFMWMANRTTDPAVIAPTAHIVVIADMVFTATAVIAQPLTGASLAYMTAIPVQTPWMMWSIVLYALIGACWLPVVFIQISLRNLAAEARNTGKLLSPEYHRLFRISFVLVWPAFAGTIIIFMLMIMKLWL